MGHSPHPEGQEGGAELLAPHLGTWEGDGEFASTSLKLLKPWLGKSLSGQAALSRGMTRSVLLAVKRRHK